VKRSTYSNTGLSPSRTVKEINQIEIDQQLYLKICKHIQNIVENLMKSYMHYSVVQIIILVSEMPVFTCLEVLKLSGKVFQFKGYAQLFNNSEYNSITESMHPMQLPEDWASGLSSDPGCINMHLRWDSASLSEACLISWTFTCSAVS